ncbi:MAG TPA: TraB/GumN family protein [Sphingomicrobium sp.]
MRVLALLLAACAALLPVACGSGPAAARPALWVVRDADTTIWLFGTIHLLPPRVDWQGAPVGDAIAQADTLVTEIADGDPQSQAATFLRLGRGQTSEPGVPAKYVALKPWAAALAISADAARNVGATREDGVEAVLTAAFAARQRQALESFEGQLRMFDGLPPGAQHRLLQQSVVEARDPQAAYARTFDAWRRGDEKSIAASFDTLPGDLRDALIINRNRRWAAWIEERLARRGKILVAVGAGHLVGTFGVPALLRNKGFKVTRVQ